jgi:FtsH-binding integral membrane protein
MAIGSQPRWTVQSADTQVGVDVGLRNYMLRIYNYMASALALTGIVAYVFAGYLETNRALLHSPVMFIIMLAPLGLVMLLSFGINKLSAAAAQGVFWLYAYTGASIARVFFITAGTFAATSLYGYTTRRDLTGLGHFMWMGLIGIIIAMLVNWFLQSSALSFAISVIGVVVFVGLTAWDTQSIKEMYYEADGYEVAAKKSVMGALRLYLDFVNLFMMLIHLLGVRRD